MRYEIYRYMQKPLIDELTQMWSAEHLTYAFDAAKKVRRARPIMQVLGFEPEHIYSSDEDKLYVEELTSPEYQAVDAAARRVRSKEDESVETWEPPFAAKDVGQILKELPKLAPTEAELKEQEQMESEAEMLRRQAEGLAPEIRKAGGYEEWQAQQLNTRQSPLEQDIEESGGYDKWKRKLASKYWKAQVHKYGGVGGYQQGGLSAGMIQPKYQESAAVEEERRRLSTGYVKAIVPPSPTPKPTSESVEFVPDMTWVAGEARVSQTGPEIYELILPDQSVISFERAEDALNKLAEYGDIKLEVDDGNI